MDGQTDRGKTVYPPPPSGSGGIIKWHIKWKYLIPKFHDICLSYYFKHAIN
jgi:hypothetical protein